MKHMFGLKPFALGLIAAVAFTAGAPDDASAQRASRTAAKGKPAAAGPQLDRERGAREAAAAVSAAGLACTITDAGYIGSSNIVVNGATVTRNAYEVACQNNLGHVVFQPQVAGVGRAEAVDCLIVQVNERLARTKGQTAGVLQCRLPGNAQPEQGLRALAAEAGGACTINNGRYVGSVSSGVAQRYEVGCADKAGFLLDRPAAAGARPSMVSCLSVAGTPSACQFTTQAQILATLAPVVAQAKRDCALSKVRIAGRNAKTSADVLELGCEGAKPGFFVELSDTGQFVRAMDCGAIRNTACEFTSATALDASRRDDFTRRLRAAGVDCTVGQLRYIGAETNGSRDVFEAACTNRPEGVYALLPAQGTANAEVYDCLLAPKRGAACQLTQESAVYPRLTTAIAGRLTNACTVNGARRLGSTPQGEDFYEIACADGRAFVVDYGGNGKIRMFLNCREASAVLGGCRAGPNASQSRR